MDIQTFSDRLAGIVPDADKETSTTWFCRLADDWENEPDDNAEGILKYFMYVKDFFGYPVVQALYDLPRDCNKTVRMYQIPQTAVLLAAGVSPKQVISAVRSLGYVTLSNDYNANPVSPLALISIIEGGKTYTYCSFQYGRFAPHMALAASVEYTWGKNCTVGDVLRVMTTDGWPRKVASNHIISMMASDILVPAMLNLWQSCKAVSAHILFDLDNGPGVKTLKHQADVEPKPVKKEDYAMFSEAKKVVCGLCANRSFQRCARCPVKTTETILGLENK